MDINMCHMDSVVLINDLYSLIVIFRADTLIKFFDDRYKLRYNLFQICKRPFFQCFRQDRMVGVSTCLADYIDRFIDRKCLFIYQNTDQFRNDHCRMRIIDLDHRIFVHLTQITFLFTQLF